MKHFGLKFNHGVEIGAELAYKGHFRRTKDPKIYFIALDELGHQKDLRKMLEYYGEEPSKAIDSTFRFIGTIIYWLCQISPKFLLNYVARSLEIFAVFSYANLAIRYNDFRYSFLKMAEKELEHENYFKHGHKEETNAIKAV